MPRPPTAKGRERCRGRDTRREASGHHPGRSAAAFMHAPPTSERRRPPPQRHAPAAAGPAPRPPRRRRPCRRAACREGGRQAEGRSWVLTKERCTGAAAARPPCSSDALPAASASPGAAQVARGLQLSKLCVHGGRVSSQLAGTHARQLHPHLGNLGVRGRALALLVLVVRRALRVRCGCARWEGAGESRGLEGRARDSPLCLASRVSLRPSVSLTHLAGLKHHPLHMLRVDALHARLHPSRQRRAVGRQSAGCCIPEGGVRRQGPSKHCSTAPPAPALALVNTVS